MSRPVFFDTCGLVSLEQAVREWSTPSEKMWKIEASLPEHQCGQRHEPDRTEAGTEEWIWGIRKPGCVDVRGMLRIPLLVHRAYIVCRKRMNLIGRLRAFTRHPHPGT